MVSSTAEQENAICWFGSASMSNLQYLASWYFINLVDCKGVIVPLAEDDDFSRQTKKKRNNRRAHYLKQNELSQFYNFISFIL